MNSFRASLPLTTKQNRQHRSRRANDGIARHSRSIGALAFAAACAQHDQDFDRSRAAAEVAIEPALKLSTAAAAVVLSSDDNIAVLNGKYRGKAKPTNVLSFPSGHGAAEGYLGDIVIACETVLREAEAEDIPPEQHLQHLVVHGLLHLLGYDHENNADAEHMEGLEIRILARLGIANPYTGPLDTAKT